MSSFLAALQSTFGDDATPVAPASAPPPNATASDLPAMSQRSRMRQMHAGAAPGDPRAGPRGPPPHHVGVTAPNAQLSAERAAARALPRDKLREIELLAVQRKATVDETLGWMIELAKGHLIVEAEERRAARKPHKDEKKQKPPKADKAAKDKSELPPLSSIEEILIRKDEELASLTKRVQDAERKYIAAFALLSLDDKRKLMGDKDKATVAVAVTVPEAAPAPAVVTAPATEFTASD
jgi:hypothetical protein